jgi:hypothetical protein
MEDFLANPLPNEDKVRGKGVKKDFDSDDFNHAADIAIAVETSF